MPRRYVADRQAVIDERRRRVVYLKVVGLTNLIQKTLKEAGFVNPAAGRLFSLNTVANDVLYLKGQWEAEAAEYISEHRARHLAEIRELRRTAWAREDLNGVYRGLHLEAKVLGLYAPKMQPLSGTHATAPIQHEEAARAKGFGTQESLSEIDDRVAEFEREIAELEAELDDDY